MDSQKKKRLKEVYEGMSDEALIEMSQAPEEDYQEGVYGLIMAEIKRRGLEDMLFSSKNEEHIDFESPDGRNWVEIYRYDDDMTRMRLEAFFKELGIAFVMLPYTTIRGLPTGKGSVRVREDCVPRAEKIIMDIEDAKQFPAIFMDEELIKASVMDVLKSRNITESAQIAAEIINVIKKGSEEPRE